MCECGRAGAGSARGGGPCQSADPTALPLQVVHMGWVSERLEAAGHCPPVSPKFLAVKGPSLYVFRVPPVRYPETSWAGMLSLLHGGARS